MERPYREACVRLTPQFCCKAARATPEHAKPRWPLCQQQRSLARERRDGWNGTLVRSTIVKSESARAWVRRAGEPLASAGMERSRLEIPNDSIGISGPRRAWAATSTLSKARSGRRTSDGGRTAGVSAARLPGAPRSQSAPCSRANAQVKLRASQIRAHAEHAQSLNRPSASTHVRPQARRGLSATAQSLRVRARVPARD